MAIQYSGTIRYPAGVFERFSTEIANVVDKSRKEDGCLVYSLARDVADPDLFILLEQWEDEEAFEAHFSSSHAEEFRKVMDQMDGVEASIARYDLGEGNSLN